MDTTSKPYPETEMGTFPIDRCLPELFTLILQAVVDDEAARYHVYAPHYDVRPKATAQLALVCQSWKRIVYSTPSLWAVLPLNLMIPMEKLKARFGRFIALAKGAPVDMYVFYLHEHSPGYDKVHSFNSCCSTEENMRYFVTHVPNIRKLQVAGLEQELRSLQGSRSALSTVREAVFYSSSSINIASSGLSNLLGGTPSLRRLSLHNIGMAGLSFCQGHPLLPSLRELIVRSDPIAAFPGDLLPLMLSHSPNIEVLDCRIAQTDGRTISYTFDPFNLQYLYKITTHSALALIPTLTGGLIRAPSLRKLHIYAWDNKYNSQLIDFFKFNPTVVDLVFAVFDSSEYDAPLREVPHLELLTVDGIGHGEYLDSLAGPVSTDDSDNSPPVLATSLERIRLRLVRHPLRLSAFERLIKSRCIPVNAEGITITGCRATVLEIVSIPIRSFDLLLKNIRGSTLWNKAEIVYKPGGGVEMRWTTP